MYLKIEKLASFTLVGRSREMTMASNTTSVLWSDFMRTKTRLEIDTGNELYSLQFYPQLYFDSFDVNSVFTKWAGYRKELNSNTPEGFKELVVPGGLYAVFLHKGLASDFPKTFMYIFDEWLPNSEFEIDDRPHFELLGEKYANNDRNSEEEVWIPIVNRTL